MKYLIAIFLASTLCIPAFGKGQKSDFQTGKIVQVEELSQGTEPPAPAGYANPGSSTQAQEGPSVSMYNVLIQVGDTVYTCRLKSYDRDDAEFAVGSDVQARVTKRVLYLKRSSGDIEEARIVNKKKAETQAQAQ